MDDALIQSFRRIYSAVQRGDSAELEKSLTHDIEWTLPEAVPWGGTHHGPLGVEAVFEITGTTSTGSGPILTNSSPTASGSWCLDA